MPTAVTQPGQALQEQVACTLPVLDVMSTQLQETATQIESSVVDVFDKFQSMADRAKAGVTSAAEILSGTVTADSAPSVETLLAEASKTIRMLLRQSRHSATLTKSAIHRIRQVQEATNHVISALTQLENVALADQMAPMSAGIGAGTGDVPARGRQPAELDGRAKRSADIVELIREGSEQITLISNLAIFDLEMLITEDQKAYRKSKLEADLVLERCLQMHRSTREFTERMTEQNVTVASEVSSAVQLLQFQDRINQRIGHVISELDRIKNSLGVHCNNVAIDSQPILEHLAKGYTLREERDVVGQSHPGLSDGDVELF